MALIQDCENPGDNKPVNKISFDFLDGVHIYKTSHFDGVCVVCSCLECRVQHILSLNTLDLNGHQQEDLKDIVNSLAQVCWYKADHLPGSELDDDSGPALSLESGNNVTQQVASGDVEGVRNLGDAAVYRMSYQWSGASQEETPIPPVAALIETGSKTPLFRLKEYAAHLDKFIESHVGRNDTSTDCYKLANQQCLDVSTVLLHECQSTDTTRAFWDSCSAKLTGI